MFTETKRFSLPVGIVALAFSVLGLCGCASSRGGGDTAVRTHENLNATLYLKSAEYGVICRSTYERATEQLLRNLHVAPPSVVANYNVTNVAERSPAILLDIDETVLDNSHYEAEKVLKNRHRWERLSWENWVRRRRGDAVPGAIEFINAAISNQVRVVFITNRSGSVREDTIASLQKAGMQKEPDMLLMPGDVSMKTDKADRRRFAAEHYDLLVNVGDDLTDFLEIDKNSSPEERVDAARRFSDRWDKCWFLLPNPCYGSWEASLLRKLEPNASDHAIVEAKRAWVREIR